MSATQPDIHRTFRAIRKVALQCYINVFYFIVLKFVGKANGTRTRVSSLKGKCPALLDDSFI